jgi:hypothetical protein
MEIYYGRPHPLDFDFLVRQMPGDEFKNLTHSTIPLLAYWGDEGRVAGALGGLKIEQRPDDKLCFEYPVNSAGGNTPSYTDVMYLSGPVETDNAGMPMPTGYKVSVGVEGKATEPMYETVARWLEAGHRQNRELVLRHWIETIRRRTGRVEEGTLGDVVYQMLHRTASVCSEGIERRVVLYQVFGADQASLADKRDAYEAGLLRLAEAVGTGVKFWVQAIPMRETDLYRRTLVRLGRCDDRQCPQVVRQALLRGGLLEFEDVPPEPIRRG